MSSRIDLELIQITIRMNNHYYGSSCQTATELNCECGMYVGLRLIGFGDNGEIGIEMIQNGVRIHLEFRTNC
jgi:hypothetical protein